ncbi:SDR family NAD(P)-dependent oxidoreductase [Modestobacter sp. SYSU DS0875]
MAGVEALPAPLPGTVHRAQVEAVANVLLFVPVGALAALALRRSGPALPLALGAATSVGVRDVDKGERAAARMTGDVAVQRLDLTSLESVHAAAAELRDAHAQIDLLINNAGVMYTPKQTTQDGFERQFGPVLRRRRPDRRDRPTSSRSPLRPARVR